MSWGTGELAAARAEITRRPDVEATLGQLAGDMRVTFGWPADRSWTFIEQTATVSLDFLDDDEWPFEQRIIEDVQQRMHDEFIDVTWPPCPVHRTHPLWLAADRPWRWECGDVSIPLGQLGDMPEEHPKT